jgi:hypothetical protein
MPITQANQILPLLLPFCDSRSFLYDVVNEVRGEEGEPHVLKHVVETFGHALLSLLPHTPIVNINLSPIKAVGTQVFCYGGGAESFTQSISNTRSYSATPDPQIRYLNLALGIQFTELTVRCVKTHKF